MNKLNSTAIKKQLRFRGSKIASPMASANSAPHMLIQAADMIEAVENKVSKLPAELMADFNDIFKGEDDNLAMAPNKRSDKATDLQLVVSIINKWDLSLVDLDEEIAGIRQ